MKNMMYFSLIALSLVAGSARGITLINNSGSDKVFSIVTTTAVLPHADIINKVVPAHGKVHAKMGDDVVGLSVFILNPKDIGYLARLLIYLGIAGDPTPLLYGLRGKEKPLQYLFFKSDRYFRGKHSHYEENCFLIFNDTPIKGTAIILEPHLIAQLRSLPHMQQLFNNIDSNKTPFLGLSMLSIIGKDQDGIDAIKLINDTNEDVIVSPLERLSPGESKSIRVAKKVNKKSTKYPIGSLILQIGGNTHTFFINYQPRIYINDDCEDDWRTSTVYVSSLLK